MIAVIDYGIGNLSSAFKAFRHLGAQAKLAASPNDFEGARGLVLPGVGSFGAAARRLRELELDEPIKKAIAAGVPFLGICVGMQLLFEGSEEDPQEPGLSILKGSVKKLRAPLLPQMQWNETYFSEKSSLARGIENPAWLYYVHSYACRPEGALVSATCRYFEEVVAAVEMDNVFGVQFHPEKSGSKGLKILQNFLDICTP